MAQKRNIRGRNSDRSVGDRVLDALGSGAISFQFGAIRGSAKTSLAHMSPEKRLLPEPP
jgi:hypothetical protein